MYRCYCLTAACYTCNICMVEPQIVNPYSSVEGMSKEDAAYWTKQLEEYYYQKEYVGEDNPRTMALKTILTRKGLL